MARLSKRLDDVRESATLRLNALVQNMKSEGKTIYNLTAGEPDFPVPDEIKEAVIESVRLNRSKYTAVPGIIELRTLIAQTTSEMQGFSKEMAWKPENILVCNGAKHALFNVFMAILEPDDEVVVPAPYWLSYPEMVKVPGGKCKVLKTSIGDRFKMTPSQLSAAITTKTKALILNSPSNPTGMMYSKNELQELGKIISHHSKNAPIWVISDEIYDSVSYGPVEFCSFLKACPELRNHTITINGLSKRAAMTGWRVGWMVGPVDLVDACSRLQGQSTSNVNSLAQWASVAALKLPESLWKGRLEKYRIRKQMVFEILKKSGKIEVIDPDGAFYAWIGIRKVLKEGEDSVGFAEALLQEQQVAVVPGSPFGATDFIRISFALDEEALKQGTERLIHFIQSR